MRAEDAGARTWLYAALAGWALCAWVLALFGMGGSIDRLEEDPALAQPLPTPVAPAPERLGPLPQYADVAARPLFTEDRRPQPFVIDPTAEPGAGGGFDYVLTSVLRTPQVQLVILQPVDGGDLVRVRRGHSPEGAPGCAAIGGSPARGVRRSRRRAQPELRVFDGVGGERRPRSSARCRRRPRASPAAGPAPTRPGPGADGQARPAEAAAALEDSPPAASASRGAGAGGDDPAPDRERRARLRADGMSPMPRPPRADPPNP